uniref:Ubiquitin-like protease family profile domain-containing protein n=1 Tax=Meloidogyne incognita TaxID=6306 RepID=A0A914MV11_MELIC
MPKRQELKRRKNRERRSNPNSSLQSSEQSVQPEQTDQHIDLGTQNCPLQGNDQSVQQEQSEHYTCPHIQNTSMDVETINDNVCSPGKPSSSGRFTFSAQDIDDNANIESLVEPLTPLSISSEVCVPRKSRKTRDSSVESMDTQSIASTIRSASVFSSSSIESQSSTNKGGRPRKNTRKGVGGRPRKTVTPDIAQNNTENLQDNENSINENTEQVLPNDERNINFSTLNTLDFAVTRTNDRTSICRRAAMPLYERDDNNRGPRGIEVLWNKLSEWPNESFIFAYLCYLAKVSGKKVIVVDPVITDPDPVLTDQLGNISYADFAYQTEQEGDVQIVLLPVHLPGHWTIIIFDREFGFYFFDSLPTDPNIFSENHHHYHPDRMPRLMNILSQLTNTSEELIHLATYATNEYTLQRDGFSCGYFICLYAEAWLFNNRNLKFNNFNNNTEKKRILWHLNQLYSGDNVEYHPRNEHVHANIRVTPIHNLPSTSLSTPRMSTRASTRASSTNLTPVISNITVATPKGEQVLPVKRQGRGCLRHKGMGCASFKAGHFPEYYNSGQFGDKTCQHCDNRLLRAEKCLSCTDGRVRLDPLKEYPHDYARLVTGESMDSKEYIRDESKYNTLFAFGSLSVGRQNAPTGGPMPVLLNGEFARRIGSLTAADHQIPSFDQLYILDSKDATEHRMNNTSFADWNKKNPHLFHVLDKLIRAYHPMAEILKNSYEFYKDIVQNSPENLKNFKVILVEDKNAPAAIQDPNLHPRQVNLPTQNESTVFAIWSSNTDEQCFEISNLLVLVLVLRTTSFFGLVLVLVPRTTLILGVVLVLVPRTTPIFGLVPRTRTSYLLVLEKKAKNRKFL